MMEDVLKKELRTRMKRLRSSIPEKTRKEKAFAAMKHLLDEALMTGRLPGEEDDHARD